MAVLPHPDTDKLALVARKRIFCRFGGVEASILLPNYAPLMVMHRSGHRRHTTTSSGVVRSFRQRTVVYSERIVWNRRCLTPHPKSLRPFLHSLGRCSA